jgi:hypothetical protein
VDINVNYLTIVVLHVRFIYSASDSVKIYHHWKTSPFWALAFRFCQICRPVFTSFDFRTIIFFTERGHQPCVSMNTYMHCKTYLIYCTEISERNRRPPHFPRAFTLPSPAHFSVFLSIRYITETRQTDFLPEVGRACTCTCDNVCITRASRNLLV